MPSSSSFTGIGLSLQSVTPTLNNTVLRVRFTNDPKRTNPTGPNDSLNVLNWALTGGGFVGFQYITPVGGDTQSVDLTLTSRLTAGLWTITVANVQTVGGTNVSAPLSLSFNVVDVINLTVVNPGSSNDNCEGIIRKHLNPALVGPGWTALISGLAAGDCPNFDNSKLAFDQLYKISASGKYLDRITANDGIIRPKNVGMSDEIYRHLAIKVTNNKVVNEALLEVLAVYYGEDAVRAHATTEGFEPYFLSDGDDLNVTIDGLYSVKIIFRTAEFSLISAAKAEEVAGSITRAFLIAGVKAFAKAFIDTIDGKTKVKIYTGSLGLKGTVQIKGSGGGKAQDALKFETPLNGTHGTGNVYTGIVTDSFTPDFLPIVLGTPCVLTWSHVTPIRSPREQGGNGAQFLDGRVVVSLGINQSNPAFTLVNQTYQNKFDLYSASGAVRTSLPDFPGTPLNIQADTDLVTLGDGRILGTYYDTLANLNTATLDPGTLLWTSRPACPHTWYQAAVVTLQNGNALVIGAGTNGDQVLEYDQILNTWSSKAPMLQQRKRHKAIVLDTGKVLVTGGQDGIDILQSSELYNPNTDTWSTTVNSLGEGKIFHSMAKMANGRILIVGGYNTVATNKVYMYDPTLNIFVNKASFPGTTGLYFTSLVALDNNYIASVGGVDVSQFTDNGISRKIKFYDANTDVWTDGTDMAVGRVAAQVHELGGCKIFIAGGEVGQFTTGTGIFTTQSVEVSNLGLSSTYYTAPGSIGWNFTTFLSQARTNLTGVDLADGRHMVIGGQDFPDEMGPGTWYANCDIINALGTAVAPTTALPWSASHVVALLLPNGKILAAGGWTSATTGTANMAVFDPAGPSWTAVASMPIALRDQQMALQEDGTVVLISGRKDDGTSWPFSAIYDPIGDTWSTPAALPSTGTYGAGTYTNDAGTFTFFGFSDSTTAFDKVLYFSKYTSLVTEAPLTQFPVGWTAIFRPGIMKLDDGRCIIGGGYKTLNSDYPNAPSSWDKTFTFVPFGLDGFGIQGTLGKETTMDYPRRDMATSKAFFSDDSFPMFLSGSGGNFTASIIDTILFNAGPDASIERETPFNGGSGGDRGFASFKTSDGKTLIVGGFNEFNDFQSVSEIWKSVN